MPNVVIENPIVIGNFWSQEIQLTFINGGVDAERSEILNSDLSNPCSVKTKVAHGLSSGKVVIDGHTPNVNINGNQTIVVVDAQTFTVTGIAGVQASEAVGIVEQIIDASGYSDFTVTVATYTGGAALANPEIILTWIDRTIFDFLLTIIASESDMIVYQSSSLVITVSWIDDSGGNGSIDILVNLQNG